MSALSIIIPCYNEEKRLTADSYVQFAREHADVQFVFVNDGSKDDTEKILFNIVEKIPSTKIITLSKNSGKGEAVRQGLIYALYNGVIYTGYTDADLSTPLEEVYKLVSIAKEKKADIVLGSRIKKADTRIERSFVRHVIGRCIATLIDKKFKLGIYDTQCGAKVFNTIILKDVIENKFITSWFFDVEIIVRLKKAIPDLSIYENPLGKWTNIPGSKIRVTAFGTILKDIISLLIKY